MAILIFISIFFILFIVILSLLKSKPEIRSSHQGEKIDNLAHDKKIQDEELITIILPTINNDGK